MTIIELRWLYGQRNKYEEKSDIMIGNIDKKESVRQNKASKRTEAEAEFKKKKKLMEKKAKSTSLRASF